MIKAADVQGRGIRVSHGTPRLDKASLNQKERRRKVQVKKMHNYSALIITFNYSLP